MFYISVTVSEFIIYFAHSAHFVVTDVQALALLGPTTAKSLCLTNVVWLFGSEAVVVVGRQGSVGRGGGHRCAASLMVL